MNGTSLILCSEEESKMRTLGRTAVGHEPDVLAQQRKLSDTKHTDESG